MIKHEEKSCPRCNVKFECKVGSISLCQCAAVKLNDLERAYLQQGFSDCLCANCMKEVRKEFNIQQFKNRIKKIMGIQ